ncbi:MAG: TIGR04255 family protein [Cyclobacteriaceae bacterium]
MDDIENQKLLNAPLQEVIFELLWEIGFDQQGNPLDSEFEFAQGLFAKEALKAFPQRKRTIPEGLPLKIYPKTIHQFWKGDNIWPVVQLGPGILAINDTEQNYKWEKTFYPLIKNQIDNLEKSYGHGLIYKTVSLRYIDAVEISKENKEALLEYVNSNFNVKLYNNFRITGSLSHLNLTQTFNIGNDTLVSLILNDGINKFNKPALIWQIHLVHNATKKKKDILLWADSAHKIASDLFKDILKKEFYDSFK